MGAPSEHHSTGRSAEAGQGLPRSGNHECLGPVGDGQGGGQVGER